MSGSQNLLLGGSQAATLYVDDVFSTYLYTGNGSTQTITNSVQLGDVYGDDPYYRSVVLLLHMNGANNGTTFTDSSLSPITVTATSAVTSTAQIKYGTASGLFSGTDTSYLSLTGPTLLYTGKWTIEVWIRPDTSYTPVVWAGGGSDQIGLCDTNRQRGIIGQASFNGAGDAVLITSGTSVSATTWAHLAVTCDSGTITLYVNGNSVGSTTTTKNCNVQRIGEYDPTASNTTFLGYMDDLRITNGVVRYQANFTPPSSEFSDSNSTVTSGKGGLVWIKSRSAATDHQLFDTARTATYELISNSTAAQVADADTLTAFNSNGFSLGADATTNTNAATYASWTFRKAAKFFDVVTYTGNGTTQTISHNLGIAPGMIIVKKTTAAQRWAVYYGHNGAFLILNDTATADGGPHWNSTSPTSTQFTVGTHDDVNTNGATYVAYLFAHDTATDGIIQCGSYTGNGSATGPTVTLGWEPQLVLIKSATLTGEHWSMHDTMRGMSNTSDSTLFPSLSLNEQTGTDRMVVPTATGFKIAGTNTEINSNTHTYIYLAIRRPNKPPTSGTQVYSGVTSSDTTGTAQVTNFPVDMQMNAYRSGAGTKTIVLDRLRGVSTNDTAGGSWVNTRLTDVENTSNYSLYWNNAGFQIPSLTANQSTIYWNFRRAPGVFDVVCYTGTGSATTVAHNLGVVPEMMIIKYRDGAGTQWHIYHSANGNNYHMEFTTAAKQSDAGGNYWNLTTPTASVFSLKDASEVNTSAGKYVAYLFATKAGISKVGSYTGNGSSQTIDCGFAAGARFLLIKRTDSTGDWYVYDTARGINEDYDPHLSLNTTAAEVNTTDDIDSDNSGFIVNQNTTTNLNVTSAVYIFLAFA